MRTALILSLLAWASLSLPSLTTLQHQRLALDCGQRAHDLEAVAGSFQYEQVLWGGMFFSPTWQLGHRHFVECFFQHGGGRRGALQQRGGEGVRVRIKADHPSGDLSLHFYPFYFLVVQADGNGSGDYMHSGMRGGPHVGAFRRCSFTETEIKLQASSTSISRKAACG